MFDAYFLADGLAIAFGGGIKGGNAKVAGFEPVTLFSAIAPLTKSIGFIANASTTYEEPYNLARKFASLDLISDGRAGWNVVTTATESPAHNFNLDQQHPHAFRYKRAAEHVDVVKTLWDSFEDDAFLRDKEKGRFFDPEKEHYTDHKGEDFKVKGPLNVGRSSQGHPVIVQAGQSDDGRGLASATAEVFFTAHLKVDAVQEFYHDIKTRGLGRNPDPILVMPGVSPFVGRPAEVREKYDGLANLILEEDGIALIKGLTGDTLDLTGVDPDGPLPEVEPTEGMKSRQALIRQIADESGFTIRQL